MNMSSKNQKSKIDDNNNNNVKPLTNVVLLHKDFSSYEVKYVDYIETFQ